MSLLVDQYKIDILLAVVLAGFFAISSHMRSTMVPDLVYNGQYLDIWFESDCPRVFEVMTDRNGDHSRSRVHPLFSLVAYPPVFLLKKAFGLSALEAVRFVISFVAFLWMAAFYTVFRISGCRRLDSILWCLVAALSSAGIYFFAIPETYPFASLTLLFAWAVIVLSQSKSLSWPWYVLMNIATISITTTNWMLGVLGTLFTKPIRHALWILSASLGITTVLWCIQKVIFPSSNFFMDIGTEKSFINREEMLGSINVAWSFFYHSLIMPVFTRATDPTVPGWSGMITQPSSPGSASIWGKCALVLWTLMLIGGVIAFTKELQLRKLRIILGLSFLGQIGLHMVYGFETFLYSLHFIVLLLILSSAASLTRYRDFVLAGLIILIPCLAINNLAQFQQSLKFIKQHYVLKE